MRYVLVLIAICLCGLVFYIRFASSDPQRWHVDPVGAVDPGQAGVLRRVSVDMAALDRVIRTEPRVRVLAGSVGEGHITYIVRSRVFGFPDYVSVKAEGADLVILSRLRFGANDVGVNAKRLDRWLEHL